MRGQVPGGLKSQVLEHHFLPQQPILPANPGPQHIDGVLLPFNARSFSRAFEQGLRNALPVQAVTMAETRLRGRQCRG